MGAPSFLTWIIDCVESRFVTSMGVSFCLGLLDLGVDFAFEDAHCGAAYFWREFFFFAGDLDVDFAGAAHFDALIDEQKF